MCGINGFNFQNKRLIKQMNDSLKHRGPDAGGTFFDKNISLGHRRLAIIDLSPSANQPMGYIHKRKRAVIVYNGEVYNFREIRSELEKKGYNFKTKSDTEVILASYLYWGKNCVNKFNGMWAFCIYDKQKQILFLSRDRLGQKPLYYYNGGGKFIFSSEVKGILAHKIKKELNKDSIDLYLSLGFIPAPYSIYKDINKLEAGHNLIFNLKTKKLKKERYFYPPRYNPTYNKKKLKSQAEKLISNATKIRLISDVPLGAFLSGGIDSSTIVYNMKKYMDKKNLNTFSIGFEEGYDETPSINIIKDLFQTNHHHKLFEESNFNRLLKKIFYYYDEPFADPSMFPTFFLSKFARKKLTVALSGDGGDEMFGGYPRYQKALLVETLKKVPKIFRKIASYIPHRYIQDGIQASFLSKEQIFSKSRPEIYKPKIFQKISEEKMNESLKLTNGKLSEAVLLYDRYFQSLPDNYLNKVDRASMAHGLEVRSPFLDYRFIELSAKIPSKLKFSLFGNKILLKKIALKFLPERIIKQKKMGFTPPIESWILKENYKKMFKKILNDLYDNEIISENWYNFYERNVFNKEGVIYANFKIRLYLLGKWAYFNKINT